ncbi:MAG: hypothetical protein KDC33_00735 [Thermoleophilia bacterium]|nr:hypothetical protein [Thermoleophilia bacterium]
MPTTTPSTAIASARRVALAAAGLAALATSPALAADPVMPLADVRPGMTATAYTVVQGTQIVSFPLTILDVTRAGDGPGSSLIVVRAEGPLMQQTGGIAQGMSGSPVYITGADGVRRVIGALAYGQGDEANVVGGVTPIEQMIANTVGTRQLERTRAVGRPVRIARSADDAARLRRAHPGDRVFAPLMRWSAAGLDPRLVRVLRRRLGAGVQVDASGPGALRPPVTLEPGASLSAQVIQGPVALGAIGTVTYVDGDTVLGFGHPFLGAGPEKLIMADAHITTVVAAPIKGQSYKLGVGGRAHGMIVGDRRDGVVGRSGPVEGVTVIADAYDTARGTRSHMESLVAPQPELVPVSTDLLQIEPVLRVRDGSGRGTLTVRYTIETPGMPTVHYRNVYAAEGDVTGVAGGRLGSIVGILTDNPARVMVPRKVTIDEVLRPGVLAATIVSARTTTRTVRPGKRAVLALTVRMWRGPGRRILIPFRVPAGVGRGVTRARITPYDPTGFDSSAADLVAALEGDGTSAPLRISPAGPPTDRAGAPERRVVRIIRRSMDDRHDAVRLLLPGEDAEAGDGRQLGTDGVVIFGGRATLTLRVGGTGTQKARRARRP